MEGIPQYERGQGLLEALGQLAPLLTAALNDLRPLVEPWATSLLGASPWDMLSPFQQQRSTDPFVRADMEMASRYQRDFVAMTGRLRSDSPVGRGLGILSRSLLDREGMGAAAYRSALRYAGVGMSFAHSMFGSPMPLPSIGATTAQDITEAFVDMGAMSLTGLRPGERQAVLGRMMRGNKRLLSGYSADMSVLRGATEQGLDGLLAPRKGETLDNEAAAMLERVNTLRQGVREMDSAIAAWKEVLNKDVMQTLDALGNLFGGDVVSTFTGTGNILQDMALRARHTAALSGMSVGSIMKGVGPVMQTLGALGAPPEAALAATVFAAGYAADLGGYRGGRGAMEQGAALSAGHAVASPYGRMLAGAYMRFMGTDQGMELGYGAAGRKAFQQFLGDRIHTAESLNELFDGPGWSDAAYRRAADTDAARDYMSQDDFIMRETVRASRVRARELYFRTDRVAAAAAEAMGESAFFAAMGSAPDVRARSIRDSLRRQGWGAAEIGDTVRHLMTGTEAIVRGLKAGRTGGWENLPDMDTAALMRFLDDSDYAARREEIEARTRMDRYKARSGSYLMAGLDLLRSGDEEGKVTVRGIMTAVTGLSGREADLFYRMGGSGEEEREAFIRAMERLKGSMVDPAKADRLVRGMFTELRSAYDRGDETALAAIRGDITSVLSGRFVDGRFSFIGGEAAGEPSADVQYRYIRASDAEAEALRAALFREAGAIPGTDASRKAVSADVLEEARAAGRSLVSTGMRVEDREVAAVAAAMRMTMDTLAEESALEGYVRGEDGKWRRGDQEMDSERYERISQSIDLRKRLKALADDSNFLSGSDEARRQAVSLLQQTEKGGDLLTQARGMAGSGIEMSTWAKIIEMLVTQLGSTPLKVRFQ